MCSFDLAGLTLNVNNLLGSARLSRRFAFLAPSRARRNQAINNLLARALSNLLSARSLLSHKGASKMLRATGHARMVSPRAHTLTA